MSAADLLTMLGALAVLVLMLVLTWYATRWYARRMGGGFGAGRHIKVIDRVQVGMGASLLIVEISSRHYLIGAGDKSLRLICELPDFEPPSETSGGQGFAFGQMLGDLMRKARVPKDFPQDLDEDGGAS